MPYRYLDDVAIADLAFEADAPDLESLFEDAAQALCEAMVDTSTLTPEAAMTLSISADSPEDLLYRFLSQIVYLKDSDMVLFKYLKVKIQREGEVYKLTAEGPYDHIDPNTQDLRMDVKAVTYHMFVLQRKDGGWTCRVVVDV
jgi:SHS2 domain-containing protein